MRKVVLVTTGGTIASRMDKTQDYVAARLPLPSLPAERNTEQDG